MALTLPKAVVFDWDNTLVDSWPVIQSAMNKLLAKYNRPLWTLEETRTRVAHSLRDSFPLMFGDEWEQAGRDYQAFYLADHLERLVPLPLVETTLHMLQERGVVVSVVSNKRGDTLRKESTHLGWDKYFHRLIGSTDAVRDKPAPEPVAMALEGSAIRQGDVMWFIGDAVVDVQCAKAVGAEPILFGEEHAETMKDGALTLQGESVAAYVRDHAALQELIETVAQPV